MDDHHVPHQNYHKRYKRGWSKFHSKTDSRVGDEMNVSVMELSGMDGPPEEILGGFAEVVARSSSDLWPLVLSADSSWLRHLKIGYTVYLKIPWIIHDNSHFPHEHCLFDGWIIGPWRTSQVVWRSSRTSACPLWRAKLAAGTATQQLPPVASWAPSPGSRPVARPAQHHTREGPWGTAMQHNGCGVAVEVLVTWWLWMFFFMLEVVHLWKVWFAKASKSVRMLATSLRTQPPCTLAMWRVVSLGFNLALSNDWLQNWVVNQYLNSY